MRPSSGTTWSAIRRILGVVLRKGVKMETNGTEYSPAPKFRVVLEALKDKGEEGEYR